jgi:hypothetical protein
VSPNKNTSMHVGVKFMTGRSMCTRNIRKFRDL